MKSRHSVIFVPGLGDRVAPMTWATKHWERAGLTPIIYPMHWHDSNESFSTKLKGLLKVIDQEIALGHQVSLAGCSAGGSAVINAYMARKNQIHKVVNICGRLRVGETSGFRAFDRVTNRYPAFAQSVIACEKNLKTFSKQDLKKIMTLHPIWDEVVPSATTTVPGAHNLAIPSLEHSLSIFLTLTRFSNKIVSFLQ